MTTFHLNFSAEQDQFRDIVRRFLETGAPPAEIRRVMAAEPGFDPALWQKLCGELALAGLHVPERYGGSGFGPVEVGIAMEELGRALTPSPYLASSVLAANALLLAGSESQRETLLPELISGARLGCVAWGNSPESGVACRAEPSSTQSDVLIDGGCDHVIDGAVADLIIVAASSPQTRQTGLYLITDTDRVSRTPQQSLDPTRRFARLTFASAPATPLSSATDSSITQLLNLALTALACEMVGGAQKMLDSAVDYARMRVQFGRTIASFQAIKHKCADMLLEVESARSAAYVALQAAAEADPEFTALASLAKVAASEAFMHAAAECIQIHGGIGFTWENDTHLWFKRAKVSEMLFGDNAGHRERMLKAWEI